MPVTPMPFRTGQPERPSATTPAAQIFSPASIGAHLESMRAELSACCEDLKSVLPVRGLSFVEDTALLLPRLTCRIAIIGQVKAGKSSFINAFIRRPGLLPTHVNPWTTAVTHLHFGQPDAPADVAAKFTFFDANEWERLATGGGQIRELTQRLVPGFEPELLKHHVEAMRRRSEFRLGDSMGELLGTDHQFETLSPEILDQYVCSGATHLTEPGAESIGVYSDIVKQADLYFQTKDFSFPTVIVDTPGTNDPFLVRDEITRRALEAADIYIVVLTARQALSSADIALLRILRGLHKDRIAIFINRIDELGDVIRDTAEIIEHVRQGLQREFDRSDIPIVAGSAMWAQTAIGGADPDIRRQLSARAKAYATHLGLPIGNLMPVDAATPVGPADQAAKALMQCSGLPELCTVVAGLTMRSHAGHVLKQIANSLSELTAVSLTSARHEMKILDHEGKTEVLRHDQGGEELRLIKAEVRDNEQLTLTLHGLLIDLQSRTDQTIDDQCTRAVETLEDIVHDFSEVEGSKLEEMIAAGQNQRVWTCDTTHLRRMIERSFVQLYRETEHSIAEHEAYIFPKLRELLEAQLPPEQRPPTAVRAAEQRELPSLSALGQTVALDLATPWWKRWWSSRRSPADQRRELDRVIRQEFYPIVHMLVKSARTRLKSQQARVLQNSSMVYLSLVDLLQEQSRERLTRTRELMSERSTTRHGERERARTQRIGELERNGATATQVARRLEEIERAWEPQAG